MREVLKSFPKTDNKLFAIDLCGISYCDGSYKIKRENSKCHCFEYIISGTGTVVTDKGNIHPEQGDVYFLRAGEDHFYYSDSESPWTKIWFNIRGELIDKLVDMYGIGDVHLFKNCRVFSLFDEFNKNANSVMDYRDIENQNAIILHQIIQAMADCIDVEERKYSEDAIVIKEYIDSNYSKPIKIEELSGLIYRSQSQTIRIFKKNYGMTPYEYALKRKMYVAKQLLKSTRMPIREISAELGFANEHYFSSCFKQHVGMTPGKYRK